jgi:hypothetical protein
VEVVPTASVALVDVPPRSKLWENPQALPRTLAAMRGGIVRAQPPAGATDEQVAAFRAACHAAGADTVRVLPRARGAAPEAGAQEAPRARAHRDLRAAAEAEAARTTHPDPAAVLEELGRALAAEGL